jgi:hypothetical protein
MYQTESKTTNRLSELLDSYIYYLEVYNQANLSLLRIGDTDAYEEIGGWLIVLRSCINREIARLEEHDDETD